MSLGIMVTMNQRLDAETLTIVADGWSWIYHCWYWRSNSVVEDREEVSERQLLT
jgi:hypothetical protein